MWGAARPHVVLESSTWIACSGTIRLYVPSLVQAAAKAAKRHTTNTRSAFDFMAMVLREDHGELGEMRVIGLCSRESSSAVNRWRY
jgi:hypothetical protein